MARAHGRAGRAAADQDWNDLQRRWKLSDFVIHGLRDHGLVPDTVNRMATVTRFHSGDIQFPGWRKRCYDPDDEALFIFDNQADAAFQILCLFASPANEGGSRWVTLFAEMQSGKTGVVRQLFYWVNILGRGPGPTSTATVGTILGVAHDNLWFLLNKPDNSVLEQAIQDLEQCLRNVTRGTNGKHPHIFHAGGEKKVRKDVANPRRKVHLTPRVNALIGMDESHWGAKRDGAVHNFLLDMVGCDPGDPTNMEKDNVYIVSVSATPMLELHPDTDPNNLRRLVILESPPLYYSVERMLTLGRLRNDVPFFPMLVDPLASFGLFWDNEVPQMIHNKGSSNFFIFVRISKPNYAEQFKEVCEARGAETRTYDASSDSDFTMSELDEIPLGIHVVFLKGLLRLGKRVDTTHIGAMIEVTPKEAAVDTLVQGLIGRACGPKKESDGVLLYCDVASAQEYVRVVRGQGAAFSRNALGVRNGEVILRRDGQTHGMYG